MNASLSPSQASLHPEISVEIIPADARHESFIHRTWIDSYRDSRYARAVKKNVFFNYQNHLIDEIVARSKVLCWVDPKMPEQIYSWVCFEEPRVGIFVLHYLVTKRLYQRMHFADRMLFHVKSKEGLAYYSHKADTQSQSPWLTLWLEGRHGLIYNPYLARRVMP